MVVKHWGWHNGSKECDCRECNCKEREIESRARTLSQFDGHEEKGGEKEEVERRGEVEKEHNRRRKEKMVRKKRLRKKMRASISQYGQKDHGQNGLIGKGKWQKGGVLGRGSMPA